MVQDILYNRDRYDTKEKIVYEEQRDLGGAWAGGDNDNENGDGNGDGDSVIES